MPRQPRTQEEMAEALLRMMAALSLALVALAASLVSLGAVVYALWYWWLNRGWPLGALALMVGGWAVGQALIVASRRVAGSWR